MSAAPRLSGHSLTIQQRLLSGALRRAFQVPRNWGSASAASGLAEEKTPHTALGARPLFLLAKGRKSGGLHIAPRLPPKRFGIMWKFPVSGTSLALPHISALAPKPAKASFGHSLQSFYNLDLELGSLRDIDYTVCCCHSLISLCLSGFLFQRAHHLGSFPHFISGTGASSRDYSVGLICGPQRLSAKSTFPSEPNYRVPRGHWLQWGMHGVVGPPLGKGRVQSRALWLLIDTSPVSRMAGMWGWHFKIPT